MKNVIIQLTVIVVIVFFMSLVFSVSYMHTLVVLSAWAAFGHLITLDDDMLGGWSNPDSDKKVWRGSLIELLIKFVLFLIFISLSIVFPDIAQYGSR